MTVMYQHHIPVIAQSVKSLQFCWMSIITRLTQESDDLCNDYLFWFFISFVYLVDLIAVAAQSRYNLWFRNATLLVSANARWLHLVTKPSSQLLRNCGTVFWRRSETFRPSHLLNKLSKHTLLRQLLIDLFIHSFSR